MFWRYLTVMVIIPASIIVTSIVLAVVVLTTTGVWWLGFLVFIPTTVLYVLAFAGANGAGPWKKLLTWMEK